MVGEEEGCITIGFVLTNIDSKTNQHIKSCLSSKFCKAESPGDKPAHNHFCKVIWNHGYMYDATSIRGDVNASVITEAMYTLKAA